MTPDALRAAIASARKRPRMYGAAPMHAAAYLLGMIAGAAPDGAAVNAAWLDAYAAADPLHPTDAEVCDAAEATVAALWPQGDDAPALDLDAIEARAAAADPGPWRSTWPDASDPNSLDEPVVESLAPGLSYAERMVVGTMWHDGSHAVCSEANAAFIAAARTDVPALVAEVRRLRARRVADLADHVAASARWGDRKVELLARVVELEVSEKALRAEVDALKAQAATKATTGDAEGAAFATAHPYAAGAILGGIAHRSEGGDRGA